MDIKNYLLSVTAAALLCSIATKLIGAGSAHKQLIQTAAGLILLFTVIQPLAQIRLDNPLDWVYDFSNQASDAAQTGQLQANSELSACIKQQAEAYILDKAASYGAEVQVEVILREDALPVPVSVIITADVSPYVKVQLRNMLEQDFGITGENQIWK